MPASRQITMPEGWSQAKQRTVAFFFDQHKDASYRTPSGEAIFENGRPYWAYVEKPANGIAMPMPVGEVIPIDWTAPWYAPQKYIVKSIGRIAKNGGWHNGPGQTNYFRIDYGALAHEDREATNAYYELAVNEAARLNILPLPLPGQPLPHALRVVVGRPPRSPAIAEAAMAGDRWLLGQQMPVWDERKQAHVIPENVRLARLIRMSHATFMTPEQAEDAMALDAERAPVAPVAPALDTSEMDELKAALRKELDRMRELNDAEEKRRKGGRPPKTATPAGV